MTTTLGIFNAPEGWTDLTTQAGFTATASVDITIISHGTGGVWWGGAAAPTAAGGDPMPPQYSSSGNAANVWLRGPNSYSVRID